jgi:hypothetical protein
LSDFLRPFCLTKIHLITPEIPKYVFKQARRYIHDQRLTAAGFDVVMGKIDKGVGCSVVGCSEKAIRSVSAEEASQAKLNISEARRAYLCKKHYRELKKHLRHDKRLQKWRWNP